MSTWPKGHTFPFHVFISAACSQLQTQEGWHVSSFTVTQWPKQLHQRKCWFGLRVSEFLVHVAQPRCFWACCRSTRWVKYYCFIEAGSKSPPDPRPRDAWEVFFYQILLIPGLTMPYSFNTWTHRGHFRSQP